MANRRNGGFLVTNADKLSGMNCKCMLNEVCRIGILKKPFKVKFNICAKTLISIFCP